MTKLLVICALIGILTEPFLVSAKLPDWVSSDMLDMVADDKARCMSEHGTSQAAIDDVNEGILSDDRSVTCYMHCLFESFSLIDEDGVLETDMLSGFLPDDIQARGIPILSNCAAQDGADNCEKIYKIAKCIYSQAEDLWFLP